MVSVKILSKVHFLHLFNHFFTTVVIEMTHNKIDAYLYEF